MKKRMQKIIALVLIAGMVSTVAPAEADTLPEKTNIEVSGTDTGSEMAGVKEMTATDGNQNASTETLSADSAEKTESSEETDRSRKSARPDSAVGIGQRIQLLLDSAREFGSLSEKELTGKKAEIREIRSDYEKLEEDEKELLLDSIGYVDDAEVALDRLLSMIENYKKTGNLQVEQTGNPSSFRFINGKKINAAVEEAVRETAAAAAEESGESEQTVKGLAEGELEVSSADASEIRMVAAPADTAGGLEEEGNVITLTENEASLLTGDSQKYLGIDISQHNAKPDFDKIKAAGVQFVIIRLGYGDDDTTQDDTQVERNIRECERVGLPWGGYVYSYAMTWEQADSEVDHALRLLKGKKPELPVYIDIEDPTQEYAIRNNIRSRNSRGYYESVDVDNYAWSFCRKMKEKGYKTGLYASLSWFYEFFQTFASRNEGYSHWIAQWAPRCTYTGTFDMWQYSAEGRVDGLNGNVDMDYYYGSVNFPDAYYSNRDDDGKTVPQIPMYRLYNPLNKEHFYTMSENERDTLCMLGWDNEGIGWYAPKTSNTPVYRLYNPFLRDHHYTTSTNERDTLASIYGWTYEGIGWYSDDKKRIPVYREFNPRLTAGSHNYTTGKTEHDFLQTVGWIDEGISWYACKKG